MAQTHELPSAWATGVGSLNRTVVEWTETIGKTSDPAATVQNSTNSAISLMKGMLTTLGLAAGSGNGAVNSNANVFPNLIVSLGERDDAAATVAANRNTAISLLKGIAAGVGL
jgi:hypothetical protein